MTVTTERTLGTGAGIGGGRFNLQWVLYGAGVLLTAGVLYFALVQPIKVLPQLAPAPAFELLDQWGEPYRSFETEGRTTLYAFTATRDRDRFSALNNFLLDLSDALQRVGWHDRVGITIMTVDPEFDSVDVLRESAQAIWPDPTRVSLVTGPPVAVKLAVGTGFGVYYEPPRLESEGPEFVYDSRLILVDSDGVIRARYDEKRWNVERLLSDLDLLFTEQAATGVATLAYSAAHLFLCFPR